MKKTLNSDILTEKQFNDLKLEEYKKSFDNNQNLEAFLKSLPYSDEFPRLNTPKHLECKTYLIRAFSYAFILAALGTPFVAKFRFNHIYSHRSTIYYIFPFGMIAGTTTTFIGMFHPVCQIINRGHLENVQYEEEIYRTLVEKCNLYDNIDAILSLKHKYSLYELEQLNKEKTMKKNTIIVDNMDKFANMRRNSSNKI